MSKKSEVCIRALRSLQAGVPLFSFFLPGSKVLEIADVCRLTRSSDEVDGFQREPIQRHIQSIVQYLNSGAVLFPNAILLALSPKATFVRSRGPAPAGIVGSGEAGVLHLPMLSGDRKCAWIVDGQQRSVALSQAADQALSVPVVAFVSDSLQVHREQFILVNKARPLPKRLIDELLPELDAARLPADMQIRQIPSELVNRLNSDPESPFYKLVRRSTTDADPARVVIDSALVRMLKKQINQPLGALASYRSLDGSSTDPNAMYAQVVSLWSEVKKVFPDAWGRPADKSRLMHSAGIEAMGNWMDFLMTRATQSHRPSDVIGEALRAIAPACAWTSGRWVEMDCAWNEVQATTGDVRKLTEQLIRLTHARSLRQVA